MQSVKSIKRGMAVIHPGKLLKSELIEANELSVSAVANMLAVSRQTISNIINGKTDISPEMALRLATVFGGTAEIWLRLQAKYDLQQVAGKVKSYKLKPYHETIIS